MLVDNPVLINVVVADELLLEAFDLVGQPLNCQLEVPQHPEICALKLL